MRDVGSDPSAVEGYGDSLDVAAGLGWRVRDVSGMWKEINFIILSLVYFNIIIFIIFQLSTSRPT